MARTIRAALDGPGVELGSVPAADVARLIIGLERALARAAYVVLRKQQTAGRHPADVERATRLRFLGVERGSVIELLGLPDIREPADDELDLPVGDLSSAALEHMLAALTGGVDDVDPELASALAQLGDELGIGERNQRLSLSEGDPQGHALPHSPVVVLDAGGRRRLRRISSRTAPARPDAVAGVLVEADFERRTARLQPPSGSAVTVTFDEQLGDEIYAALRRPAQLEGEVIYDPRSATAREVRLRHVLRAEQLELDDRDFYRTRTVDELAAEQDITGVVADPDVLAADDLSDADRNAFLEALQDA